MITMTFRLRQNYTFAHIPKLSGSSKWAGTLTSSLCAKRQENNLANDVLNICVICSIDNGGRILPSNIALLGSKLIKNGIRKSKATTCHFYRAH